MMAVFARLLARAASALAPAALLFIAGCGQVAVVPDGAPTPDRFDLESRIAVRHESDGYSGSVRWSHGAERDVVELFTPTGGLHARLSRDPAGALMEMADGKRFQEADAGRLSRRLLGWELPLDHMRHWLFARAAPGLPASEGETGPDGRPRSIRQGGWTVHYREYAPGGAGLPVRIEMEHPGLRVKLLVARWRGDPMP